MITKDAYALFCVDKNGNSTIEYPKRIVKNATICDKKYSSSIITIDSSHYSGCCNDREYISDLAEVQEYLQNHFPSKYIKVLICKVVDLVSISIKSEYKEQE